MTVAPRRNSGPPRSCADCGAQPSESTKSCSGCSSCMSPSSRQRGGSTTGPSRTGSPSLKGDPFTTGRRTPSPFSSLARGGVYTTGRRLLIAALVVVIGLSISSATPLSARQPSRYVPVSFLHPWPVATRGPEGRSGAASRPATTYPPDPPSPETPVSTPSDTQRPRPPQRQPKPVAVSKTSRAPSQRSGSSSYASGLASWYCSPSHPTCMHGYPPGSMVAAACGKLRAAMGLHWRGQVVTVRAANGRSATVRLVDWCGSTTKLIDLYQKPMSDLGGTGVLKVRVEW